MRRSRTSLTTTIASAPAPNDPEADLGCNGSGRYPARVRAESHPPMGIGGRRPCRCLQVSGGYLQYLRVVDAGCSGLGLGVGLLRVAVGLLSVWLLLIAIREIESFDVGPLELAESVGDAAGEFVASQVEGVQPGQVTQRRGDVSV